MTGTAVTKAKDQREQMKLQLAKFSDSFARVLPRHMTADRMVTLALVAATKSPELLNCTPESIALAVMQVSQWGLDIGKTAHLVPFGRVCTAIPDWKGLVQLMIQSGHVRDVKARCVYSNERFIEKGGAEETLEHYPIWDEKERGELVAAYATATLRYGRSTWEVMSKAEIERIRQGAVSKNSPAWKNHYAEMAKKTVIRRLAKRLPQTPDLQQALYADDAAPAEALVRYATSVGVAQPDIARITAGIEDEPDPRGTPMTHTDGYDVVPQSDKDDDGRPVPSTTTVDAAAGTDGELPLGDTTKKPSTRIRD